VAIQGDVGRSGPFWIAAPPTPVLRQAFGARDDAALRFDVQIDPLKELQSLHNKPAAQSTKNADVSAYSLFRESA
jgi:hypothetical protein